MSNEGSFRDLFATQLEAVGEDGKAYKLSAYELVRLCLPEIRRARKNHYTWEAIASTLQGAAQEKYGQSVKIAASTAKRTYYKLTGQKKSRRQNSRQSTRQTSHSELRSHPTSRLSLEEVSTAPEPPQVVSLRETDIPISTEEENPVQEAEPAQGGSSKKQPKKNTRFIVSKRPGAKPINIL